MDNYFSEYIQLLNVFEGLETLLDDHRHHEVKDSAVVSYLYTACKKAKDIAQERVDRDATQDPPVSVDQICVHDVIKYNGMLSEVIDIVSYPGSSNKCFFVFDDGSKCFADDVQPEAVYKKYHT